MKILVLGSAQDAGLPQIACGCGHCERARREPEFARLPPCVAVIDEVSQEAFVVDATPDISRQLDRLRALVSAPNRFHGASALFITHAHIGHYPGLLFLGREAGHANNFPVHASSAMAAMLRTNRPFSHLSERGEIALHEFTAGAPLALNDRVAVTAFEVPHRNEDADTHGFVFEQNRKRFCYIPDIDAWTDEVVDIVASCDLALLDGTFYSLDELPPGRMKTVRHPLITESMERLAALSPKTRIVFTHLNHSNPACDPASEAARAVAAAGFGIAQDQQLFDLR